MGWSGERGLAQAEAPITSKPLEAGSSASGPTVKVIGPPSVSSTQAKVPVTSPAVHSGAPWAEVALPESFRSTAAVLGAVDAVLAARGEVRHVVTRQGEAG